MSHAEPTTHGAAGATGSRSDTAAAAAGHHQGLHAEHQSHRHQSHRRHCRHSHCCLHRRHQQPHPRHHSHPCHHLPRCPHHHSRCPLHHPCYPCSGVSGGKGGGGAPLKEGRARSAKSSTYNNCTSLSCKEMVLEEVNSEGGGVKGEKVVPDRAKRVGEASDYEVEGDEHRGLVLVRELSRDGSVVASVASAQVRNQVLYYGKG
ncbi:unnamed protein product [Closterium sp. NIES-53]